MLAPIKECSAAISKLTRLQAVGAWLWSTDMLSALTACTQLTQLAGGWEQGGNSSSQNVKLPSVVSLSASFGCPSFAALANLTTVQQARCFSAGAFTPMARHCTALRELLTVYDPRGLTSLPSTEPVRECTAAFKALSCLSSLTCLEFMIQTPAELLLLVDAVCALLPYGIQRLEVSLFTSTPVQLIALMHLAKLRGLKELVLDLNLASAAGAVEMGQDAGFFLGALNGIRNVQLVVPKQHVDAFVAANDLEQVGLPYHKSLTVKGY
jgi:hypothetical protein